MKITHSLLLNKESGMRLPILVFHICAGISALLSGAVAMSFRKGSHGHRVAGNVFVISMLSMATAAVYLAFMKSQVTNILGGVLTFYMVTTAWLTARRKDGDKSIFDWVALLFALVVGGAQMTFALQAAYSPTGLKHGYPASMFLPMGCVVLLAAAGDIRMLVRGGIFGAQRIARHLWRMCFALFIAPVSFPRGPQRVSPLFKPKTNVPLSPPLPPLVLVIFGGVRVPFQNE